MKYIIQDWAGNTIQRWRGELAAMRFLADRCEGMELRHHGCTWELVLRSVQEGYGGHYVSEQVIHKVTLSENERTD